MKYSNETLFYHTLYLLDRKNDVAFLAKYYALKCCMDHTVR